MREDKISCENSLVNLISQKETLEEVLRNYFLFPKLNSENINESILKTFEKMTIKEGKNFQFYIFELKILKKETLINNLFKYFFDQVNKLIDKNNFSKICEQCLKCLFGEISIDAEDLFHLLTKKLYDYFKSVTDNTIPEDNQNFILDLEVD